MNGKSDNSASLRARAYALGIEYCEEITEDYFAPELTASLPLVWVRAQCLLPGRMSGKDVLFTAEPANLESQQKAALAAKRRFIPVAATPETIFAAIEKSYAIAGLSQNTSDRRDSVECNAESGQKKEEKSTTTDLLVSSDNAPVTRLVNSILLEAVKQRASDIHFEPFSDRFALRYRIDGLLYDRPPPPKHLEASLVSRLKVMAGMDIAEKRLPQDGMAQAVIGDRSVDIRVSTIPVADGERVALRLLNRNDTLLPMSSLGMPPSALEAFRSILRTPNGVIIVSGPTGSGKTTTLYSALGEIDSHHRNILTIEDPVEYRLPNIGQIQVKPKIGLTFASGLRHILRQDPDVVLVGETRDPETAEIAVRASLTGHLVFTTLHTNDAPSAVTRLIDMGIQPYLLASSLRGVLGQRLVRVLCGHCAKTATLDEAQKGLHIPAAWHESLQNHKLRMRAACPRCIDGYSGRTGIFELMTVTPLMREIIRDAEKSDDDIRQAAMQTGMLSLTKDALEKVKNGITDLAEIAGVLAE